MGDVSAYDYIIVGAGSAGCVLAERLSASDRLSVLLIEEGPPGPDWLIDMPRGYGRLLLDERYASRFAVERGGSVEWWLRGKLLGGSSSVNGTVWLRGSPEDFDSFARSGMTGWGWTDVLPYFMQLENRQVCGETPRSAAGPIPVRASPVHSNLAEALVAAATSQGIPRIEDENRADVEGITDIQHTIGCDGRRVGAKRAFLDRAAKRPNLRIATRVRADRVLVHGNHAIGVACTAQGRRIEYRCLREIIVAAGTIASPALLQRSGIGDAKLLRGLGIEVHADSREVGRNLQEHMVFALQFRARRPRYSENRELAGIRLGFNVMRYVFTHRGPLSWGAHQIGARVRSDPAEPRPDLRLMYAPFSRVADGSRTFEGQPGVQMIGFVLRPESRGELSITSPDPEVAPRIRPNYLATENDCRRTIAMVRVMRRIMRHPLLSRFLDGETSDTVGAQTDVEILEMVRTRGSAGFHTTSTCAVGGRSAVLDSELRVRGVQGLRVVDCSIFPSIISGHTNAAAMVAGLRASDLILEARRR